MSSGGVFILIADDGKIDRMLMASKLLSQRIKDVMCARKRAGKADITPTLVDIERTHILYVNAHFKPFAAIGFEYNKVRPQSGNATLGGGVTFSIPQFGDFFYDMVIRTRIAAAQSRTGSTPTQATGSVSNPALFPFNGTNPDGTANAAAFYNLTDAFGNVLVDGRTAQQGARTPVTYRNMIQYCEYPGIRLHSTMKFEVNGNPLDNYEPAVISMLEKFCVPPNKRRGHDVLHGQEVPVQGYGGLRGGILSAPAGSVPSGAITRMDATQSNQTLAPFAFAAGAALPNVNGVAGAATAIVPFNPTAAPAQRDISRLSLQFFNGPQTPKPIQPPLEAWHKLRFWFNDDVRLSIASVSIPFGQRYINTDLEQFANLCYEFPGLYLQTIIDPVSPVPLGAPTAVRSITYSPVFQKLGIEAVSSGDVGIEKIELYINNIFVNPEIHDIYIKRIGFTLIRVYRIHRQRVSADGGEEKLLSQLKWPVEYIFFGLRPVWNTKDVTTGAGTGSSVGVVNGGNQNLWRDWHRLTFQANVSADRASLAETPAAAAIAALGSSVGQVIPDRYWLPVPTVDTLSLTSHGITIYDSFTDMFYNSYAPFQYGGYALSTPEDPGAMFVNLALFPRSYQPSGHLNISRARETYIKWTSHYITSTTPADLLAVAIAINFLLITDGSAVLRYST